MVNKLKGSFLTLLEILLVLLIISFLSHELLKVYFKPAALDKKTEQLLIEQNIDTTSYKTVVDSTKAKVKDVNRQLIDRVKKLEEIKTP